MELHVINIFGNFDVCILVEAAFFGDCTVLFPARAADRMNVTYTLRPGIASDDLKHILIDLLRAERAAAGNDVKRARFQPELLTGLRTGNTRSGNRISGQENLILYGGIEKLPAFFKADADLIGIFGQHALCDAGERILLLNQSRNPKLSGSLHGRPRHIAAGTDDHIRLKIADDPFCSNNRCHSFNRCVYVCERELPLEAAHLDEADRITRLGNKRGFHPLFGADKSDLRARRNHFDPIGNGNGRVDMTAGAAAGHQYFQTLYTYLSEKGESIPFRYRNTAIWKELRPSRPLK